MAKGKGKYWIIGLMCFIIGALLVASFDAAMNTTSSNEYCMSCHTHEQADLDWKKSPHYLSHSGVVTDCADCHLPPKEDGLLKYYMTKSRMGAKDLWAKMTKVKRLNLISA